MTLVRYHNNASKVSVFVKRETYIKSYRALNSTELANTITTESLLRYVRTEANGHGSVTDQHFQ